MKRNIWLVLAIVGLFLLVSSTAFAASDTGTRTQTPDLAAPYSLDVHFKINVVFVGYHSSDINMSNFNSQLPTTYDPIMVDPFYYYNITLPVGIHGDYEFVPTFTPDSFNDSFFSYLASAGTLGKLTDYQTLYNQQVHKTQTVSNKVLYIDAPSTERWLANHARDDLQVDISNYTIFFVNWWGRSDFQYHVYQKTDSPDPDTHYNFGALRASRKMIAWGGSFSRTWFYDLSAGPEAWTFNYNVDDADVDGDHISDYRMPPVWEYGNTSGYRPFTDLSGDLGKVLRYVAVDLLFTSSPIYDPLASEPFPGFGKRVYINLFEDDPGSHGLNYFKPDYIKKTMTSLQPQFDWSVKLVDHKPLTAPMRRPYRIWAELNDSNDCWNQYGDVFSEMFCFIDAHRQVFLPKFKPEQAHNGGVFAFNSTDKRLGTLDFLGVTDDNWVSGNPSYIYELDSPGIRASGYGFSTTTTHEFGHYIGLSHPHDGYDSTSNISLDPTGDYLYAWSGDESHTMMTYIDVNKDFGWFDRDNMNRFLTARYIGRASEISAQLKNGNVSRAASDLLRQADSQFGSARAAFSKMDYDNAVKQAESGFAKTWQAAQASNLNIPLVPPAPQGAVRTKPPRVDPVRFRSN